MTGSRGPLDPGFPESKTAILRIDLIRASTYPVFKIIHDLPRHDSRDKTLEERVAWTGKVLTETQVALEKKKDDLARGEIETTHPACRGSQDTFDGELAQKGFPHYWSRKILVFCRALARKKVMTGKSVG